MLKQTSVITQKTNIHIFAAPRHERKKISSAVHMRQLLRHSYLACSLVTLLQAYSLLTENQYTGFFAIRQSCGFKIIECGDRDCQRFYRCFPVFLNCRMAYYLSNVILYIDRI
jgi:hypothetical protein